MNWFVVSILIKRISELWLKITEKYVCLSAISVEQFAGPPAAILVCSFRQCDRIYFFYAVAGGGT